MPIPPSLTATAEPIIGLITEWTDERGELQIHVMIRIWAAQCDWEHKGKLVEGTKLKEIYGSRSSPNAIVIVMR